jgi:hypothetical protein
MVLKRQTSIVDGRGWKWVEKGEENRLKTPPKLGGGNFDSIF